MNSSTNLPAARKIDLRPYAGHLVIATSVLHILVGFIFFSEPIADIINAGVFNTIGDHMDRSAGLWFVVSGAFLWFLGLLIRWTQAQTGTVPSSLGWSMLGISIVIAILLPASGAWLLLLLGILLIAVARQGGAHPTSE